MLDTDELPALSLIIEPLSSFWRVTSFLSLSSELQKLSLVFPAHRLLTWSLGCILLFVFIGKHIFHRKCRYRKVSQRIRTNGALTNSLYFKHHLCIFLQMKQLVKLLGQPGDHLLKAGPYTLFFCQLEEVGGQAWWLNVCDLFIHCHYKYHNQKTWIWLTAYCSKPLLSF